MEPVGGIFYAHSAVIKDAFSAQKIGLAVIFNKWYFCENARSLFILFSFELSPGCA